MNIDDELTKRKIEFNWDKRGMLWLYRDGNLLRTFEARNGIPDNMTDFRNWLEWFDNNFRKDLT